MSAPDLWRASVRRLLADPVGVPDADLLARFRTARDEAAFELLVYRHGPLVWAACRRRLSSHHDAEDAFQAAFLALARRAGSIRRAESVPAWLHRVAVRAARHLNRTRRPARLVGDPFDPTAGPSERAVATDLARHLDAAVDRLPDRLRRVFVACELQGEALAEVAGRLRCPIGTVASRLARARERVRDLLSARGLAVGSLAGLAVIESVPPAVRAVALRGVIGGTGVRPTVAALAAHSSRPALGGRLVRLAGSLAVGVAAVAIAVGMPDEPRSGPKPPAKDPSPGPVVRMDAEGIPLPDGVIVRLGSARFRHGGTSVGPAVFAPPPVYWVTIRLHRSSVLNRMHTRTSAACSSRRRQALVSRDRDLAQSWSARALPVTRERLRSRSGRSVGRSCGDTRCGRVVPSHVNEGRE